MQCAGLLAEKVPRRIMRCSRLWNLAVLLWFHRVYEIRE
jgi:hypothetical protein